MILQQTDSYIKSCMKAWLLCQSCIHSEATKKHPRRDLIDKCRLCAGSCFAVVGRLISNDEQVQEYAFRCLLDCSKCYEECEKYAYIDDIEYCGEVCISCAETMKTLMFVSSFN